MLKPGARVVKLPCTFNSGFDGIVGLDKKFLKPPSHSSDEKETERQSRSGGMHTNRLRELNGVLMDSELEVDSEQFDQFSISAKTNSQVKADRFIPLRKHDLDCAEKSHL